MMRKKEAAFTLVELLVAVVIIGILAVVGLSQFFTAQARSRDAQRKENLSSVVEALELYYNDHGVYPVVVGGLPWGGPLRDGDESRGTLYMATLPNDPVKNLKYDYQSDGTSYKLYAYIEHKNDSCFEENGRCLVEGYSGTNCGSDERIVLCLYCLSSPNISCRQN